MTAPAVRLATAGSLADALADAAARGRTLRVVDGGAVTTSRWSDVFLRALLRANDLQAAGVGPGERVALLTRTSLDAIVALQAVWLAGGTVTMLPPPFRESKDPRIFAEQTRARITSAGCSLLLVGDEYEHLLGSVPGCSVRPLSVPPRPVTSPPMTPALPDDPDRVCILQFTSGSTGPQRIVPVRQSALLANLAGMQEAMGVEADDVFVGWLPLHHDMGLVVLLLLAMTTGSELVIADPAEFVARPGDWMRWISDARGTITCAPQFAYTIASRTVGGSSLQLGSLRIALNGAELIRPDAFRLFFERGRTAGLSARAAYCAYGMAEATVAVTMPAPGLGMNTDHVQREAIERGSGRARNGLPGPGTRELALVGRPIGQMELRIRSARDLGDREIGEIQIRGPDIMLGYLPDPTRLDASPLLPDGWLGTGDLGYRVDGELVVCGRLKDLIIRGGRNISPEEVEWAVTAVHGIRAGNVAAFAVDVDDGELIVVMAEVRERRPQIERAVRRAVREAVGVVVDHVVLLQPGELPKTSSGKLQRFRCRDQFLVGRLP